MTGHCHHGGHHGGTALGMHADQSPAWNMAMQKQRCETELGRRLTLNDPRIMIGFTIFVFLTLLLLPYIMDYLQDEQLKQKLGAAPERPDSSGPSAAALSMVGATLCGGGVSLESALKGRGEFPSQRRPVAAPQEEPRHQDESEDANDAALDPHNMPELVKESRDDTVKQMLEASGMAGTTKAGSSQLQAIAGARVVLKSPAVPEGTSRAPLTPLSYAPSSAPVRIMEYGGAVPVDGEHFVYVPGQQFGQAPAQPQPQLPPQPAAMVYCAAPPSYPAAAQPPAYGQAQLNASAQQAPPRMHDPRNAFNPDTSAIVSPLGQRHHSFAPGAMMQSGSPSADGGQRFKMCVSR